MTRLHQSGCIRTGTASFDELVVPDPGAAFIGRGAFSAAVYWADDDGKLFLVRRLTSDEAARGVLVGPVP